MHEDEFKKIIWPDELKIEFYDGTVLTIDGTRPVYWDSGNDAYDSRENMSCSLKKKSPSQKNYRSVVLFFDEMKTIASRDGTVIWPTQRGDSIY